MLEAETRNPEPPYRSSYKLPLALDAEQKIETHRVLRRFRLFFRAVSIGAAIGVPICDQFDQAFQIVKRQCPNHAIQ